MPAAQIKTFLEIQKYLWKFCIKYDYLVTKYEILKSASTNRGKKNKIKNKTNKIMILSLHTSSNVL